VGKANLRIGKYSGSSNNGSGLPGSYTSTNIVIDPPDANITWNAATGLWQITFDVTGFGGFIVQTSQYALPVTLLSFAAQITGANVRVHWKTAAELDHDYFELERSTDGRHFTSVASIEAIAGTGTKNYDHTDAGAALLNTSKIYYRLKMISNTGDADYSHIITVYLTPPSTPITRIGPNPFHDDLEVGLYMRESGTLVMQLTDLYGRCIVQEKLQAPKGFSTQVMNKAPPLMPGVYLLTVAIDAQLYSFKVLKQ
jgi:hypothetical protein